MVFVWLCVFIFLFLSPGEGVFTPVDIVGFVSHHDRTFFGGLQAVPHIQALRHPATNGGGSVAGED